MVPFECGLCIFHKLRLANPNPRSSKDILLMATIRRMNLDDFWSRGPDTVNMNRLRLLKRLRLSQGVGLHGPCIYPALLPSYDHCGYKITVQILLVSREPGRNAKDHLQFDTMRQMS